MSLATEQGVDFFSLKTPYLTQGITHQILSATDSLRLAIKVYVEGGENLMHQHPHEDHAFVILEGEATFHVGTEDDVTVVGPYEGVMLPKGALYRFESSGESNLVMLRVGASNPSAAPTTAIAEMSEAFYPDGVRKSITLEPKVKQLERIEAPGPAFGERA